MLDAPIQVGGRMIGVICLEHIGPCRHWSLEEESFAASLADLIALSMEVNERRRANEALRDSEERYRTLAENFPHGTVILFDHDLRYIVANGLGLKEIGLSREMMEGKTIWEVLPAETCEVLEPHYQAVLKGETRLFEIDYAGKTFEVHALPIRKGPGAVQAGMVMAHDITERKRAQSLLEEYNRTLENQVRERTRELQEKQAQLIQSEKMAALGNLVAGIVHEINSPLGALNSNNDMVIRLAHRIKRVVRNLDRTSQNEANSILCSAMEQIEELENVSQSATERIMKIVSSLRSFAGLDQAAVDQVEIHDGLESTITLLQHELDGRITIYKDFAAIPPIRCSPSQLNQAFMNILLNAIQAIEGVGQILVRTAKVGEWAVIEFVDSGHGIAENDLARIFDPGFTTKGVKVGTGLGLAIVHRIIEEHGGRIEVESEVGKGSTFRIMLPLQEFPHNQVLSNQNP
jgi:PAS domain S-box-containing protein